MDALCCVRAWCGLPLVLLSCGRSGGVVQGALLSGVRGRMLLVCEGREIVERRLNVGYRLPPTSKYPGPIP